MSTLRGITFETCSDKGPRAHGRVETRIRMLQEVLERYDVKGLKLHSRKWSNIEFSSFLSFRLQLKMFDYDTCMHIPTCNKCI